MSTTIMEKRDIVDGKTTLVRRVSDLFKADGNKTGPPLLFRHVSMQKLRHCCQNLNLFPYLLYSFGTEKAYSVPMMKVNICLDLLLARITERIYRVYSSIRITIIRGLCLKSVNVHPTTKNPSKLIVKKSSVNESQRETNRVKIIERETARKFEKFEKSKPKRNPFLLKLAVYVAPIILAFQLIGVFSLLAFGKYTPGFAFLFFALICLGCISMKVLNHDTTATCTFKREKRKVE